MEPDSCQSIETGSKMAPSSQIPDIHSNHLTLLNISQYLPFTDGLPVPHKDKKVGGRQEKTWKEYNKLSNAVGLKSDISSHKMRHVFPSPKNKTLSQKVTFP